MITEIPKSFVHSLLARTQENLILLRVALRSAYLGNSGEMLNEIVRAFNALKRVEEEMDRIDYP